MSGLIYARISQKFGETDDSLDNQVKHCELAASTLAIPIYYTFREKDSGHETADTRKDLLRARELVCAKKVSHFFIHNFDRLSRTPEELVTLWKECQRNQCKVVVAMWPQFHDMDLEMAKMMLRMIGMVGEFEWSFIRARTTQNKQQIRDKGQLVGEGGPRFGFAWDKTTRSRRPNETPHPTYGVSSAYIVRTIFDLIGNHGYSLRRTARELNQRGWPTPAVYRGKKYKDNRQPKWTNDGVRLIVIDEQYKGVVTCSRSTVVNKNRSKKKPREQWTILNDARTEPLVSEELWENANKQIRDNDIIGKRRRAAETRNENNFALFRGLAFCGQCGSQLRPVWVKSFGGTKVRIYRCDSRVDQFERNISDRCYGKAIYENKVKDAIWSQVVKVAVDEGMVLAEAERLKNERPGEALHRATYKSALSEVAASERRIKNLIASLAETDDPEDRAMVRTAIDEAKQAREGHRKQAARLAEQLSVYDALDRQAEELIERCRQLRSSSTELLDIPDEEKRYWLERLRVTISGNGLNIHIRFDLGLADRFQHPRATSRMNSPMLHRHKKPEVPYLQYIVATAPCS